jgi:hypothetical protein
MVTPRSRTPESAPPAGYLPGDVDFDI